MSTGVKRGLGAALVGAPIWLVGLAGVRGAEGGLYTALALLGVVGLVLTLGGLLYAGVALLRSA